MASVGRVRGPAKDDVVDRKVFYDRLRPCRKQALDTEFGDAPSFNYVLFDQVWDARAMHMNVYDLARLIEVPLPGPNWQGIKYLSMGSSDKHSNLLMGCLEEHCIMRLGLVAR